MIVNGYGVSSSDNENVIKLAYSVGCTLSVNSNKNHSTLHFKQVNFMVHKLYLNKAILKKLSREFPGSPGVRTLCFHCKGHGLDPWSGN